MSIFPAIERLCVPPCTFPTMSLIIHLQFKAVFNCVLKFIKQLLWFCFWCNFGLRLVIKSSLIGKSLIFFINNHYLYKLQIQYLRNLQYNTLLTSFTVQQRYTLLTMQFNTYTTTIRCYYYLLLSLLRATATSFTIL